MKFRYKIHQQVRLLKSTDTGVIAQIYTDGRLLVIIDDMLEVTLWPNEVVPLHPEEAEYEHPGQKADPNVPFPHPEGLYVALHVPEKTNVLHYYLVNHSPLTGVFFLLSREGLKWRQKLSGEFKPHQSQTLFYCAFNERESDLYFQFLIYDPTLFRPLAPLQKNLKIKEKHLLKKPEANPYLGGAPCVFSRVATLEDLRKRQDDFIPIAGDDLDAEAVEFVAVDCELPEGVVDLHAEKLVDRPENFAKHELFEMQIQKFERTLNQAMARGLHKISFIHGIGAGTLKNEIHRILLSYRQKNLIKHYYLDDRAFDGRGTTTVVL
ncbi:MAG: hypothetical protein RMM53_02915 [Bacteroidia bacterium]|nr:hypothetical protein [Bacteroidia bacterium]